MMRVRLETAPVKVQCCQGRQTSQGLHALVCNETALGQVQCCEGRQTSQGLHALVCYETAQATTGTQEPHGLLGLLGFIMYRAVQGQTRRATPCPHLPPQD
jgi:hypothetical protein